MAYLALARKWRPRFFGQVVGQPHVVRALENALDGDRVHHAYLFAGTRGVGKTTLARILAKALNCEKGVTASPCGECQACQAVEEGRFVDLIEVDAASRTKVEQTRELLDNVQYAPSSGRFKVYLIDEVHMLSASSFNALLKTLEEPPPHVKFLLATTDPQKVPVTVLSRCLQFNLKRLPAALITAQLHEICGDEGVDAEAAALERLGRAAAGSMRDGLSLLDQALALEPGSLSDTAVAAMLGASDRDRILPLLNKIGAGDGPGLMDEASRLAELSPDYDNVLAEMAAVLQRLALIQVLGLEVLGEEEEVEGLEALAALMPAELIQLCYQIALTGRRDLSLAPDPSLGFEMTLLRMLAFRPAELSTATDRQLDQKAGTDGSRRARTGRSEDAGAGSGRKAQPDDWVNLVESLSLDGAVRQLAAVCSLSARTPEELTLTIARKNAQLLTDRLQQRLESALRDSLGDELRVIFDVQTETGETLEDRRGRENDEAWRKARESIEADQNVLDMMETFGAKLDPGSVRPAGDLNHGDQE